MVDGKISDRVVNILFIPGFSGLLQTIEPPANYFDLLANLGVGGILAGVMLWVLLNQIKAHNAAEVKHAQELAEVKLAAADRIAKNEAETRGIVAGMFSRSTEIHDRSSEASKAMATALTELTGAVKGIADAQALVNRIASLESKVDAVAKR